MGPEKAASWLGPALTTGSSPHWTNETILRGPSSRTRLHQGPGAQQDIGGVRPWASRNPSEFAHCGR